MCVCVCVCVNMRLDGLEGAGFLLTLIAQANSPGSKITSDKCSHPFID